VTNEELRELFAAARNIAVVGLSPDPARPSHQIASYLQRRGYRIFPVNPRATEVLGESAYARLEEIPEKIDIVDVFRRSEEVPAIADSAIAIGARCLWLQVGVEHAEAEAKARAAGLQVISNACIMVVHRMLV
jgi:predicted CoA-binding protein